MIFLTFLIAATPLAVTPGPGVAYVGVAYVIARTVAGAPPACLNSSSKETP